MGSAEARGRESAGGLHEMIDCAEMLKYGRSPLLFKEGWPRHQENVPFRIGADGVVSLTTPSAPIKLASLHFLDGRSHPSLKRRELSAVFEILLGAQC